MNIDFSIYEDLGINTKSKTFKRFLNAGLLDKIDEDYIKDVKFYWKENYGKEIDPVLHLAFYNLTGKKDLRVVPMPEMWNEILPYFNDMDIRVGYSDKNIYDRLISPTNTPDTILKRVRGLYFNHKNDILTKNEAAETLKQYNEFIIKPSNTDNGKGVSKVYQKDNLLLIKGQIITFEELEEKFNENFIVQEVIEQHPIMAEPHPDSVNSLRMVTFRWKNEIKYLLTFARFGAHGEIKDNAGTGGVCVGVNQKGEFLDVAVDEHANTYTHHPSTGFKFSEMKAIPNFDDFKSYVIDLHKNVLHHDLISWDIAVDVNGAPVFIEANYRGATWLYQMAIQDSFFGDLTEEVLNHIKEIKSSSSLLTIRNSNSDYGKLKQKHKKLKNRNKELLMEVKEYKRKNKRVRKKLKKLKAYKEELELVNQSLLKDKQAIINSKSWRYTQVLRKLRKKLPK